MPTAHPWVHQTRGQVKARNVSSFNEDAQEGHLLCAGSQESGPQEHTNRDPSSQHVRPTWAWQSPTTGNRSPLGSPSPGPTSMLAVPDLSSLTPLTRKAIPLPPVLLFPPLLSAWGTSIPFPIPFLGSLQMGSCAS